MSTMNTTREPTDPRATHTRGNDARPDDELGSSPIGQLIAKMSIPSIIGVFAYNLYNLLDTLLLSQGAGMEAVGGVAVSFPLFVALSAIASTLGSGGASMLSRAFGRGDEELAARIAANTFLTFYATAISVTVLGLLFLDPLLELMGVTDTLMPVARDYTRIILIGAVTSTGFSNLIRAEGSSRYAMAIWVIPLSVNMAFDLLFIFGFGMEATGAALGTVLGQCVSMAMSVNYFLLSGRSRLHLRPRHFVPIPPLIGEILSVGLPTLLQLCGQSVAIILVNRTLARFGPEPDPDLTIGAYGLVSRISLLLLFPVTGLAQGIQPIIGFNHGAGCTARVRRTVWTSTALACGYGVFASLAAVIGGRGLLRLFTAQTDVLDIGAHALAITAAGSAFTGMTQVLTTYHQAIGHRITATMLSLLGQVIVLTPVLTVLGDVLGLNGPLGLDGVWWSLPLSAAIALAPAMTVTMRGLPSASDGVRGCHPTRPISRPTPP